MKWVCLFLLLTTSAYAKCDLRPLKNEIISQYEVPMPVTNEKGNVGRAQAKNFKVSDYLMRLKNEYFLIANFELDIKWETGREQTVKTLVVGTVNPKTCKIESYNKDKFASK